MLHHCLPEATSLRDTDLKLTEDQALRIEKTFSMDANTALQISFGWAPRSAHRFITRKPIQICKACHDGRALSQNLPTVHFDFVLSSQLNEYVG
jgi:hypothetical protein